MVTNKGGMAAAARAALFVLLLLLLGSKARADPGHASVVSCSTHSPPKPVADAWEALNRSPNELEAQLGLVDALIDQGCYKEAVPILEAGLAQRPRSSELQSRMRAVRSMLSEEHFFEGLGTAQETAKLQHALLRCTKAFDLSACDEALRSKPDDAPLIVAKGDALVHDAKPAQAIAVYQRAEGLLPGDEGVKSKLSAAETQRETLVSQCQGGADAAAADACQAAVLPGSPDELTLLRRRGILLQSMDQPGQALDAFIAANVLEHDDKSVALAIVALTDSTGRKDAVALAARGTSLLTLGRAAEAVQTLHQAATLAPALPGIKTAVAQAEQAARTAAKHQAHTASAKPNTPTPTAAPHPAATAPMPATTGPMPVVGLRPVTVGPTPTTYSNDATAARTN
jgi:tetratricopeptide (TPR) repeat protein